MRDLQISVAEYFAETARGGELGRPVRNFLVAAQTLNDLLTNQVLQSESYKHLFMMRHPVAALIEAVKFARNVVQHVLHIVRPSDEITVVDGELGMRVYAVTQRARRPMARARSAEFRAPGPLQTKTETSESSLMPDSS